MDFTNSLLISNKIAEIEQENLSLIILVGQNKQIKINKREEFEKGKINLENEKKIWI